MWKSFLWFAILVITAGFGHARDAIAPSIGSMGDAYVEAWARFYPSRAIEAGLEKWISGFEDYSEAAVGRWISLNQEILEREAGGDAGISAQDAIDARLIAAQARSELERWEGRAPQRNAPELYASTLSAALGPLLRSPNLMPGERIRLVRIRLADMRQMTEAARGDLRDGAPAECRQAADRLVKCAGDCAALPERLAALIPPTEADGFSAECRETAGALRALASWIEAEILPRASQPESPILGAERYARLLRIYAGGDWTPERLERAALEEIETVRRLMDELSGAYLKKAYPREPLPATLEGRVIRALADMEENRPRSEAEYLERLRKFAADAERFVREQGIATMPGHQTLSIELAPESSGAMARIGYVEPPPVFHPNPWTTWHLATIPDTHPAGEREDFWRSFNYHFKLFIVIHELFPGHYLQDKIARENPRSVRLLFPYGPYIEGWATLCERVALDHGWAAGDLLTLLAQLRKRLENANRAYTSVQVHCRGWNEEKMLAFSVGTSFLAPQFAKSLWGRLMGDPLQMTSYFLGYRMFVEVYEGERERLGGRFQIRRFMDTILRAGPIPIDAFPDIFRGFRD